MVSNRAAAWHAATRATHWLYTRSGVPITGGQPLRFVGDMIGNSAAVNTMTGSRGKGVTYPSFYSVRNGDLLFSYRTGVSGDGVYHLTRHDVGSHTWSPVRQPRIESPNREGGPTYSVCPPFIWWVAACYDR
jgi:hypothetical protein